jgi:Bacterial regulatory protein, Fis family/GAF domain
MSQMAVSEPDRSHRAEMSLAEKTLDAVADFADARSAALFLREQQGMRLFASLDIDRSGLEDVARTWARSRAALTRGQIVVDQRVEGTSAVAPVLNAERLAGLLYVRTGEPRFADDRDRKALAQFASIAAIALSAPDEPPVGDAAVEQYLGRTVADDVARRQLLVLLERCEWNIAHVARLVGVTRATVYNRIARLGIERRHVPKDPR